MACKTWISNAGMADFYVIFARSGEAPGAKWHLGLHRRCRARRGWTPASAST
jgi:hypothetical protein